MKIGEIKQIQNFIQEVQRIKCNPTEEKTRKLINDIESIYYNDIKTASFNIYNTEYSNQDIIDDLQRIIIILESKLNRVPNINEIIKIQDYILEGKSIKTDDVNNCISYIKKVISVFGERLKISKKLIDQYSIPNEAIRIYYKPQDDKNSIIEILELGLEEVCCQESMGQKVNHNSNSGINIYNSATSNAVANFNISIQVLIDNAIKTIKDSNALNDSQTKEALSKINEIQNILNSKESQKSKWSQLGKIVSWLADKAVDVAVAFLPLISQGIITL